MLGGMSTDELSGTTAPTDDHPATVRTPLLRRPWVVPLGLLTVIFIGYAVPPYLSLDPGIRRDQRRSSRMTTRGNPPETERVAAALVKPASSKSLRVPT
jgi:hypothetical protein